MAMIRRLGWQLRVARELGIRSISNYALYQLGLRTGHYARKLNQSLSGVDDSIAFRSPLPDNDHPWIITDQNPLQTLNSKVQDILSGRFLAYGGEPAEISFESPNPDQNWTNWELPSDLDVDIKDYWEPARFGWAVILAQAYRSNPNSRLAAFFWQKVEEFYRMATPYRGVHWLSAQEAALRLIHLVYCVDVFSVDPESTPDRMKLLSKMIQEHALRIPPTLPYARAQRNNHLLSEAAGLFTAGVSLPNHPLASHWMELGWHEFEQAILDQISFDGTFSQQSVCYHRLMLTLAIWMNTIRGDREFTQPVKEKLALAARWLERLIIGEHGEAPNLGSNDGSLILPFAAEDVTNYKPVADKALALFSADKEIKYPANDAGIQKMDGKDSTLFFRCVKFFRRPAHADQLHVDLWWQGENILRDPGTYRYNAPKPWENALAGTDVHNTITMDGADQMQRVGRFLWANWASGNLIHLAQVNSDNILQVAGEHPGYARKNIKHQRRVIYQPDDTWLIQDDVISLGGKNSSEKNEFQIHWLLPDATPMGESSEGWHWQIKQLAMILQKENREVIISTWAIDTHYQPQVSVFRAGECIMGESLAKPHWGWYSPTYGVKIPAIALVYTFQGKPPFTIHTSISLQDL